MTGLSLTLVHQKKVLPSLNKSWSQVGRWKQGEITAYLQVFHDPQLFCIFFKLLLGVVLHPDGGQLRASAALYLAHREQLGTVHSLHKQLVIVLLKQTQQQQQIFDRLTLLYFTLNFICKNKKAINLHFHRVFVTTNPDPDVVSNLAFAINLYKKQVKHFFFWSV